jgi:hypothetical protein
MTNKRSLSLFIIRYNCVSRGHCVTIPRFQVITLPTDRLDAGRPLKHRLPVKPSAMSSGDSGCILDSVAEASDDDRHGQCSTVNDYSPSQHKLPLGNDEEDEKLEDDNGEAINRNSGNDC